LGSRRTTNAFVPVAKVPMISSPKIVMTSECSQAPGVSKPSHGMGVAGNSLQIKWPVPDIRHLAYMTTNSYGRV
jgi:hypothetical protein